MDIGGPDITHTCLICEDLILYNFFFLQKPISSKNLQEFNAQLFYIQKYMKLYCSNIFYKISSQGHDPAFFALTASMERRLLVYLKGGGGGGGPTMG